MLVRFCLMEPPETTVYLGIVKTVYAHLVPSLLLDAGSARDADQYGCCWLWRFAGCEHRELSVTTVFPQYLLIHVV